jgi:hypothetical protein
MVELNDQDYMVPLRAFVTFAAAFATPRDPFHRYSVLVGTHAAAALRPQIGLTALVSVWMDDFDANTVLSKLNRTGVFAAVWRQCYSSIRRDPSLPRIRTSLPPATSTATTRAFCRASAMAWGTVPASITVVRWGNVSRYASTCYMWCVTNRQNGGCVG